MNALRMHLRLALLFNKEKESPTPPDIKEIPVKEPDKKPKIKLPGKKKPVKKV